MSQKAQLLTGKRVIYIWKKDLSSAFRVLPLNIICFKWLVLKAEDPRDGKVKFFVDKCLPFGASISCLHYQRFSNALQHILEYKAGKVGKNAITNYLDDLLFLAVLKYICDGLIRQFLQLCKDLNIPVAIEKTEWGSTMTIFLGILLNGQSVTLSIPVEKQVKALKLLSEFDNKRRAMIHQIQVLAGFLNFLTKAFHAGRTFMRRMYAKCTQMQVTKDGTKLKSHHHVALDSEFKFDCNVWKVFLANFRNQALCRQMIDWDKNTMLATQLNFSSDASRNGLLGFGAVFNKHWTYEQWEPGFIANCNPSIEYLKLFGVVAALLTWGHELKDRRIILFCDNMSVVGMINSSTSSCKNCMFLLQLMILNNLVFNRKVFARHISSRDNYLSDALSRLQLKHFWSLAPLGMDRVKTPVSKLVWPVSSFWQNFK